MTGGQYEIIGPDPRGTGTTMPVDCYNDEMGRMVETLRTPTRTNSSDIALGAVWSYTKQYAARCFQNEAVNGSLMSTAFVAMFPERVERMMLDGVLHPLEYQQGWYRAAFR